MPHVVTQACCGDASCVYACPVNCIHPTPDEPGFATSEMLYVDPSSCVDCGACVSACPVGAIVPGHRLTPTQTRFAEVNADHYASHPTLSTTFPVNAVRLPMAPIDKPRPLQVDGPVSIGIVGSGPSAMYAADDLLRHRSVRITMYERLDRPFGLARFGVAPDHTSTRRVMELFDEIARNPRLEILVNTEVGRDISLDDLRARHDGIIWAGGAPTDRRLEIPGIDAQGVHSATSVVGWYNGHPDHVGIDLDLSSTTRAVIVGNGNVALDVARILTTDPDRLETTDISRPALAMLRSSTIDEVVVLGRRGPEHAAFTLPELIGLIDGGANVVVDPADLDRAATTLDEVTRAKLDLLAEVAKRDPRSGPRIRFTFFRSPQEVVIDDGAVTGLKVTINRLDPTTGSVVATDDSETIDTGLVLTSIGYRGVAVDGLPFDVERGVIPHVNGRVLDVQAADRHTPVDGVYVTGWIKRGPSGFIGTNKSDSEETVRSLISDLEAGRLSGRAKTRKRLLGILR